MKIVNKSNNSLPQYATEGSAGMDLKAYLTDETTQYIANTYNFEIGAYTNEDRHTPFIVLPPNARILIPTGLYIELPKGFEAQIRPRSGLALKNGISIVNSPGTVDSDFRGEIGVILINHGTEPFTIKNGDRICQIIISKYEQIVWELVNELGETARAEGGFGHTGINS